MADIPEEAEICPTWFLILNAILLVLLFIWVAACIVGYVGRAATGPANDLEPDRLTQPLDYHHGEDADEGTGTEDT